LWTACLLQRCYGSTNFHLITDTTTLSYQDICQLTNIDNFPSVKISNVWCLLYTLDGSGALLGKDNIIDLLSTSIKVRSFVLSLGVPGVARLLAVYATCFQPPPALRPRTAQMCNPFYTGVVCYMPLSRPCH